MSEENIIEPKVAVTASVLLSILNALNGPPHHIRELQVTRDKTEDGKMGISALTGVKNPIDQLIEEYNAEVVRVNEGETLYAKLIGSFPGFETGEDVNGGDLVDWVNKNLLTIKVL